MRKMLALVVMAGLVGFGCGDDGGGGGSTIICGSGTVEQNGECVVTGDVCADGTVWDATTGTCVAGDLCDTGTHLDPVTGTCVGDIVCAADEIAHNGVCLSQDEVDADLADVVEADPDNNDPRFGGTAEALPLPSVGNSTIFTGNIGVPVDLDTDGEADQDWDVYTFDATAGDTIKVMIKSLGASAMGYRVWGPSDYLRFSPLYFETQPQRHLLLPYTGTYYIGIAPQLRIDELDQVVEAGPEGGSEHSYVGTLERVAAFTAIDLVASTPAVGNFGDLTNNLYLLKATAGQFLRANLVPPLADDAEAIFVLLDGAGTPIGETTDTELLHVAAAADDLHVLVDYVRLVGPADSYSFSNAAVAVTDLGAVPADGALTAVPDPAVAVPADSAGYFSVTIANEQVVEFDVNVGSGVSTPDIRVMGPNGTFFITRPDTSTGIRFYVAMAGTYVIEVFNDDPTSEASVTLDLTSTSVVDLGSFDSTTNTTATSAAAAITTKGNAYYKITATESVSIDIQVAQSTGVDLDGFLYTTDFDELNRDSTTAVNPSMPFTVLQTGNIGLVRVFNYSASTDAADVQVTVTATVAPTLEVEDNGTTGTAQVLPDLSDVLGQTADSSDRDYYKITPTTTGLYRITATDLDGGTSLVLSLENGTGDPIESNDLSSAPFVGAVLQAGVEYVVLVEEDSSTTDYLLTFEQITVTASLETEPNDSSAATPVTVTSAPATVFGSFTSGGDEDWYKVTLAAAASVGIAFQAVDLGGDSLTVNSSAAIEVFAADGTTEIVASAGSFALPMGDSFIKVTGYDSGGGNTYGVVLDDNPPLIYSNVVDVVVNATNSPLVDAITVPDTCVVANISIDVDINHVWRGDLVVTLTSAAGTTRILQNETGGSIDDLIGNYPADFTPEDSLDALIGEQAQGTWTLTVVDVLDDTFAGNWNNWGVRITCE